MCVPAGSPTLLPSCSPTGLQGFSLLVHCFLLGQRGHGPPLPLPAATLPPPHLFRLPTAATDEVMATANFGKIQIGIYVEIKRSDGEPRLWPRRAGRPFDCSTGCGGGKAAARRFCVRRCAGEAGVGSARAPLQCGGPGRRAGAAPGFAVLSPGGLR